MYCLGHACRPIIIVHIVYASCVCVTFPIQTKQHEPEGWMLFQESGMQIIVTFSRQSSMSPKGECCSVWENWCCWMLPLATYYHIHYHLHARSYALLPPPIPLWSCSGSNNWLLSNIQQICACKLMILCHVMVYYTESPKNDWYYKCKHVDQKVPFIVIMFCSKLNCLDHALMQGTLVVICFNTIPRQRTKNGWE